MSADMLGSGFDPHAFVHRCGLNGLIISTCLNCQRVIASPDLCHLQLAERLHRCLAVENRSGTALPLGADVTSLFERKLRETSERTLIESRCKRCGYTLLGTAVFGDLLEQEKEHSRTCRSG